MHGRLPRDEEESMADQDDEDKKNMRIMWIASGVVVLFILGLMFTIGAPTPSTSPATDLSSQSRKALPPNQVAIVPAGPIGRHRARAPQAGTPARSGR